ncbi:pilus assembly protein PilZ [Sphingomonas gilva]|uniref:Pilus assembly protein PilZ n=2 Tax=Sphingomonas gilva TaxID=2305907 RepID=A0A396RRU1_9SPHN|nr:pilus assembly protein PilZ [Sphingomonas gilva]
MSPQAARAMSGNEGRRALRKAVSLRARLRERGANKFTIDVVDLSTTGFRCETSFTLYEGHAVWLTLPGLAGLEATVAWKRGYCYGFAFNRPLHPAVFDHIVALSEAQ